MKMKEKAIIYDLYETKCYKNQYINTLKNNGYVETIFKSNKGNTEPNLIYENTETNYKTRKLAIIPATHKLPIKCDGELIIELEPITNGDQFVYIVIPLVSSSEGEPTILDKLIEQDFDNELAINLNDMITSEKCYANKKGLVFIMDDAIQVSNDFKEFKQPPQKYFAKYDKDNYFKNALTRGSDIPNITDEPVKEGFGEKKCSLLGTDGSKVETSTYSLPTNSLLANKISELNVLATATNYLGFFMIAVLMYIITPFIYKITALQLVHNEPTTTDIKEKPGILKGLDVLLRVLFLLFPAYLIISGLGLKNNLLTVVGFFIFLFIVIGIFVIEMKKGSDPKTFSLYTGDDINSIDTNWWHSVKNAYNLYKDKYTYIGTVWIGLMIFSLILLLPMALKKVYYPKGSSKKNMDVFGIIFGGIGFFSLFLIPLFTSSTKSNKVTPSG